MMVSLLIIILVLLSALLIYKKRFTSEKRIGGLYSVQLYYLVLSVIMPMLLINLGLEIYQRPLTANLPLPNLLILDLYVLFVICTSIGVGIHATSTSLYLSFVKNKHTKLEAFRINEKFHGALSHHLIYTAGILGLLMLALLEFNHPITNGWNHQSLLAFGILVGVIGSIAIIWSTYTVDWFVYIGYTLMTAIASVAIIIFALDSTPAALSSQPVTKIMLTALITIVAALSSYTLIFISSDRMASKLLRRLFPSSHDFRKAPTIKILNRKIERFWNQ